MAFDNLFLTLWNLRILNTKKIAALCVCGFFDILNIPSLKMLKTLAVCDMDILESWDLPISEYCKNEEKMR